MPALPSMKIPESNPDINNCGSPGAETAASRSKGHRTRGTIRNEPPHVQAMGTNSTSIPANTHFVVPNLQQWKSPPHPKQLAPDKYPSCKPSPELSCCDLSSLLLALWAADAEAEELTELLL